MYLELQCSHIRGFKTFICFELSMNEWIMKKNITSAWQFRVKKGARRSTSFYLSHCCRHSNCIKLHCYNWILSHSHESQKFSLLSLLAGVLQVNFFNFHNQHKLSERVRKKRSHYVWPDNVTYMTFNMHACILESSENLFKF